MKIIFNYLKTHLLSYKSFGFYIGLLSFLFSALYLRYELKWNVSFSEYAIFQRIVLGFLFYGCPWFFTLGLYSLCFQQYDFWRRRGFWFLSLLVLNVLVINEYALLYKFYKKEIPKEVWIFTSQTGYNLHVSFFYLFIPLFYGLFSSMMHETYFYGVSRKNFHYKPYLYMLLFMLPILLWASYQKSFLQAYPRYLPGSAELYWGINPLWTIGAFELSYILQFVSLEIFFRGFIVLALGQYIGSASVFPMISVYCFLHFFKPLPESIGSIFGGYILGVIAYYSRSTLGGMYLHIGIALFMEIFAYWQIIS